MTVALVDQRSAAAMDQARPVETAPEVAVWQVAEPAFGPIVIRSVIVTSVVMFLLTGLPMWAITGQVWDGIGLGAFCAFWGGPGFGVMAAGVSWTHKCERHDRGHAR